MFAQSRKFYEIILSDPAKSGLEGGAWIDGYDYQNKDKNITITKNKSLLFFSVQYIIAKPMWFPTLLLPPSWTSSWIFYNAENNTSIPVEFPKYNHCWKLSKTTLTQNENFTLYFFE